MLEHRIPRRTALKVGMGMAAPFIGASALAQSATPAKAPAIGLATLGFGEYTNEQLAKELAAHDIRTVQLFLNQSDSRYWKYNGRSDVSDLTPDRCKAIGEAYRSAGVSIHSIGVYTNLIHPDEAERNANLEYFDAMMGIGAAMDVHTFITEAGHYEPEKPEGVPYHFQEPVWSQMVATGKELVQRAEKHDATILIEPFFRGFLASAKRTRVFIEDVGSPRIRALLDPANLLEINDLEEMFVQLGPYIDCLHAKDRKLHVDRGVPAGQGDLDYPKFVMLAAKHTPNAPFILEYVGAGDYLQALGVLQGAMRA
ncbi:MAG TPA: sugar phosphate isomerase/epimerase family protein [Candidatus Hydrogenedentes bacterium]|nr:sugar phosphate isomerase/epimerase family protein [Candidatus Hydrogenedentota bacterium]HOZ49320.1 sugar phosphate isomerase/epimerase family protein [Candidatus Hydrogenedentota bacterium]HPG69673.1 sugar phosphate isomerase/epimerase family protein [Candidatus Hydrogenedentota bacterium]